MSDKSDLHIDIETFSTLDLKAVGTYRYAEEAEVIMLQYAFDGEPVTVVDLLQGEYVPPRVISALTDPNVTKHAFNAAFERTLIKACWGLPCPPEEWRCTMVHATTMGLPASLDKLSEVMKLGDKGKLKTGKTLIRKFCCPRKPTKKNPNTRLLPADAPLEWDSFKQYGHNDVEAEREIGRRLSAYPVPEKEYRLWCLDQRINDKGIPIDSLLVRNAIEASNSAREKLVARAKEITGLDNPNSVVQLIKWLDSEDVITQSLAKQEVAQIIGSTSNERVKEVMGIRQQMARASVKKYQAIARAICKDGKIHGAFQFNGAARTARWAGRILQPQNLPSKGLISDIATGRDVVRNFPHDIELFYDDPALVLMSVIRPAILAPEGKTLIVSDFSAIEARVLAWLANEEWRLQLFAEGGKLYETSAERMFNLAPGSITKSDPNRQKGKVSELALGYQGAANALIAMGALDMGLTLEELEPLVKAWRLANPAIVAYWYACEETALKAMKTKGRHFVYSKYQKNPIISYSYDGKFLFAHMPYGRKMAYAMPKIVTEQSYGRTKQSIEFSGVDGVTKQWRTQRLYGGVLVENLCQALARDCLADAMLEWDCIEPDSIILHVHDEVVAEVEEDLADEKLEALEAVMGRSLEWCRGLLLTGEGYKTPFYIKD